MKKASRIGWIALLWAALLSGLFRAALLPKDVNNYELRPARQLPALTAKAYADGSFQEDFEAALSDQLPLSQYFKKAYNLANSVYLQHLILPIAAGDADLVVEYNGLRLYRGSMLYTLRDFEEDRPFYDAFYDSYNRAMEAMPETEFYFYFIESDAVYDFLDGSSRPTFDYMRQQLHAPEGRVARLHLRDFADFQACFLPLDHHWTAYGSYRGYLELLDLLQVEDAPLQPVEERRLDANGGSKAVTARLSTFPAPVEVYFFDYPPLGQDYGSEELYRSGELTQFSYGDFYGGDEAELVFDTGRPERDDLLVIGDSYDNAVLKLLASHFGKTYSVDLRYYPAEDGFDLPEYVRSRGIERVLVIGSDYLYMDPVFSVRS